MSCDRDRDQTDETILGPVQGLWRIYFNRHNAHNKPWSISTPLGSLEINVASVVIAVRAETVYAPKPEADADDGKPSAWISATGELCITSSGAATITVEAYDRDPERD